MQPNKSRSAAVKVLALAVLFATTSSFSGTWGGDSYRVYVNNKLVLEEFVYNQKSIKSISLDQRSPGDEISVYYSHCGKAGHARHITIKDADTKALKVWNFGDGTNAKEAMTWKAKDVMGLTKNGAKLGMFYSSKELPDGKMLASIVVGKDNTTRP